MGLQGLTAQPIQDIFCRDALVGALECAQFEVPCEMGLMGLAGW